MYYCYLFGNAKQEAKRQNYALLGIFFSQQNNASTSDLSGQKIAILH